MDGADQGTRQIIGLAESVLEDLDLEVVLQRVLETARELTGARYAAIGVLDDERAQLARFITLGVGSHPNSVGFTPGHPPMRSFLGVPILVAGVPYGDLYLTEKTGGVAFDESDEEAIVLLAGFAARAIDHARRFADSQRQRVELERTVAALDATMQIARAVGGETDEVAILELVAKRGRVLVSARTLLIELLRGESLVMATGAGELPADLLGRRVPLEGTVAAAALRSGRTQSLSDVGNRARFEAHGAGHLGVNAVAGLVVPLIFRDQVYGVLVALDSLEGDEFTAEHQRLLETFAASAATAVATAQDAADERRRQRLAAAEGERRRWARELHDETLQALASVRLMLSAARRRGDPETLDATVKQAIDQLEIDIANLRALITELRPAALDLLGLEPALIALAERASSEDLDVDTRIALASDHATRLSPDTETAVYRIVQEALTNAVKHGGATRAAVEITERGRRVYVTVRDNGAGFDPSVATNGFGRMGMRERAELLGGEVSTQSAPGDGTTIAVVLPAARADPPSAGFLDTSRVVVS